MSSRRSRSGGMCTSMVFSRNSRSWRKRPAATSASTSALVAEISRTSALRVRDDPSCSNSPVSSTRSSFCCWPIGTFAISSRNSVPPSASSNRPDAVLLGVGERALDVAEELALEDPLGHAAGVDRHHRPRAARRRRVQRVRHQALAGAVLARDEDVGVGRPHALDDLQHLLHRRRRGDEGRRVRGPRLCLRLQPAGAPERLAQLTWVRMIDSSRSLSHGFSTKSRAPRRMASTARCTDPQAVITTTGIDASASWMRRSSSSPSSPDVVSRA